MNYQTTTPDGLIIQEQSVKYAQECRQSQFANSSLAMRQLLMDEKSVFMCPDHSLLMAAVLQGDAASLNKTTLKF